MPTLPYTSSVVISLRKINCLAISCPHCGEEAGKPCRYPSGKRYRQYHRERIKNAPIEDVIEEEVIEPKIVKICTRCGQEGEFYPNRGRGYSTHSWCKKCKLEYQKEYNKRIKNGG